MAQAVLLLRRRTISVLRVAALLVALLVVGPASARAAAAGPGYFGTNLQPLLRDGSISEARFGSFLAPLQAGQMTIARFQIDWEFVEPTAPVGGNHTYTWDRRVGGLRESVDNTMAELARKGIRAAPLFMAPPDWVPAGGNAFPPSRYDDFAAFVDAFAERYGPGGAFWAAHAGEFPALPTQTYELWNEVNIDEFAWNGRVDPAAYAAVLAAVRPVLKARQPSAQLLASLAWQQAEPFVAALGGAGGLAQLDGIGFHPYAPDVAGTFALVAGLRRQLDASGAPGLAIFINEAGQPVDYAGPGAQFAWAGRPGDATRAATLAFAGEALANSDCNVQQFMNYGITGSETEAERIGEGLMGILRHSDATPNLTGQAMQRASRRWVAKLAAGGLPAELRLCAGAESDAAALLPIAVSVTGAQPGCVSAAVAYDGNPLEAAELVLTSSAGVREARATTDAFGRAAACMPESLRGAPFTAVAEVPSAARSFAVACDIPGVGCPDGVALSPDGGPVSAAEKTGWRPPVAVVPAAWALTATVSRPVRDGASGLARITVRATLSCGSCTGVQPGAKLKFKAVVRPRGGKRARVLKAIYLTPGQRRTVKYRMRMRQGDELVLVRKADPQRGIPRLRRHLRLRTPQRA